MGSGANLQDEDESRELAKKLVSVSKKFGKKAVAVLTDMREPLGYKIGNWLEVEECIEVMKGKQVPDLIKVNNVLAGAMIFLGGKAGSIEAGEKIAEELLAGENVYDKFLVMVKEHEGSVEYVEDYKNLKRAKHSKKIIAEKSGFVNKLDAYGFGLANVELGGGRKKADDSIDFLSGIILEKKCGEKVAEGETICEVFAEDEEKFENSLYLIDKSIEINEENTFKKNLILDIID